MIDIKREIKKITPQESKRMNKKFCTNTLTWHINKILCVNDIIFHHQFSKHDLHNSEDVGRDLSLVL